MTVGVRKVALLVSCLPDRLVPKVLGRMTAGRAAEVRQLIDRMHKTDHGDRRDAVRDFVLQAGPQMTPQSYRIDVPLTGALAPHLRRPCPAGDVHRLIEGERPQTQAAVLSYLPPPLAVQVLAGFAKRRRESIIRSLRDMRPISPLAQGEICELAQRVLGRRLSVSEIADRNQTTIDEILGHVSDGEIG